MVIPAKEETVELCDCEREGEQTTRMFSSFLLARARDRSQTTSRGEEDGVVRGEMGGGSKRSGFGGEEEGELDMSQVAVWDRALWLLWRQSWFQGILFHNVILIKVLLCPGKKTRGSGNNSSSCAFVPVCVFKGVLH